MPRSINISEKIEQLRSFYVIEKRNPTFSELATLFNYRSKNAVYGPLQKLIQLGYIEQNKSGRITLTSKITGSSRLLGTVQAGFPSPAEDFKEARISIDQEVVKNEAATFYARVSGDSMQGAGLEDGDLLVIDRSLEPQHNKIAVWLIDGEFTVKRLKVEKDAVYLMPENSKYKPLKVTEDNQLIIWGIVTYVVKRL